jgi:arylsulfatase
MIGMSENVFINIKNRSHTITTEVEIPNGGANGVILAQAGRFGGWSLYLKDGSKPTYTYNWLGLHQYTVAAAQALPAGEGDDQIRLRI